MADGTGAAAPGALALLGVERRPEPEAGEGVERLRLRTAEGDIEGRLHAPPPGAAPSDAAILWVFGSGGGLGGPAGGVYTRLGRRFAARGVASLELAYRRPGRLRDCARDALLGLAWLAGEGRGRVALVGHSFGGAVVVTVGAASPGVVAVAPLSGQSAGTEAVADLAPRPLLVVHGTADEVLPDLCSRDLHARAREPKRLVLYRGCRHGLDECRDALDRDLSAWLAESLGLPAEGPP